MNKPARNVFRNALLASCFGAGVISQAADLPPAEVTGSNPNASAIDAFIGKEFELLKSSPQAASDAREDLIRQTQTGPNRNPSVAFQLAYVGQMQKHLANLLKGDVRDRLNAAIVIYHLCETTHSAELQDEVVTLCQDKSAAIALWGVKSAGVLLPSVMNLAMNQGNQQLTSAIFKAVEAHDSAGAIVEDAYQALDLTKADPKLPPQVINVGTDALIKLARARVNRVVQDETISPQAERDAALYLGNQTVMAAADAGKDGLAMRTDMAQVLLDLASVFVQRAQKTQDLALRRAYLETAGACGSALQVHMLYSKNSAAAKELLPLVRIPAANLNAAAGVVTSMIPVLQQVYPKITETPKIQTESATTKASS